MNSKLDPIPAGKPSKQLEIPFKENKEESKPRSKQINHPTPQVPGSQKGTFQSFRL